MSLDGNFIASREETIEKLRREFDSKTVHGWDGEVDNSSMILICFAKHFHKLYGIHDPNTEKFVIYFQFVEPRQKTE